MAFPEETLTRKWISKYARPYLRIDCGDWTYGRPSIIAADTDVERHLTIGRYCSIGEGVSIYVGRQGRHPLDTLTTYPTLLAVANLDKDAAKRISALPSVWRDVDLSVSVGHDVWIGSGATILAGVTIGTGAVIGLGAVVTKDVPDYGIAVGVPAEVTRYRHSNEIIKELLASEWWELEPYELWEACNLEVHSVQISKILKMIANYREMPPSDPPLVNKSLEDIYDLFVGSQSGEVDTPKWPDESTQRRFTGGSGISLLQRASTFVKAMEQDGAFQNQRWKGLDYGCGWGRIASYLLTKGTSHQLDMCDAVDATLDLVRRAGFKNRIFKVSETLKEGELQQGCYDFCFAMSVFTHLGRAAFENNIRMLVNSLKIGGSLYFTVRQDSFFGELEKKDSSFKGGAKLDEQGFWHYTYPGNSDYGETVVNENFLNNITSGVGELKFLGSTEFEQFLFRLKRS